MDDAGAPPAMPAVRHVRDRSRAAGFAVPREVVPALALRALARRQCATLTAGAPLDCIAGIAWLAGTHAARLALSRCFPREEQQCAGIPATMVTTLGRSTCSRSSRS